MTRIGWRYVNLFAVWYYQPATRSLVYPRLTLACYKYRLNIGSYSVITIGMTYILASMIASGIFIVAGWRGKQAPTLSSAWGPHDLPTDRLWTEAKIDLSASQPVADVSAAMWAALKRLAPTLASQSVQAEIAAPSGLLVRMRAAALTDLLEELLAAAIHSAPTSRLLLTATRRGDGIYVGVTDDMPTANLTAREGSVRGLKQRVAMRGGALDVVVRANEGATLTLRLPACQEARALPEPAKGPTAPLTPSERDRLRLL